MDSNHKITYPHFYYNQVLRSSTLNNYFAFLDKQTRLSRVHLLGCGIVDGLTFSLDGDALVLSKGVAVNKDGWLVEIPEETRYRYAADVDFSGEDFLSDDLEALMSRGGSRIKKICFRTEDDVRQFKNRIPEPISALNPDDYVVALAYGIRNEYNSRCSQDSCDLNTTDKVLEAWPVLIEVGNQESLFKKLNPMEFSVSPRKEPCIECGHGTVESFNGQILASAGLWKAEVFEAMNKVTDHMEEISERAWGPLFPFESLMQEMGEALKRVQGILDANDVQDYYISFFRDLAMALNEFIDAYNAFARKYEVLPCDDVAGSLIYLGRFDEDAREGIDVYRSIFRSALDGELRRDGAKLGRMLHRIGTLVDSFVGDASEQVLANVAFGLMKVRPSGCLSTRPVPFYYDRSKEGFYESWNADGLSSAGKAGQTVMDGYLTGSDSMNEEGWSFYPTAYQGKEISVVRGDLESLNEELRLSMDIVEAGLCKKVALTKKEGELLRKTLAPINGAKRKDFVNKVKAECAGDAFKLAEILTDCYDARLLDALLAGRSLTGEESAAFRKISDLAQMDDGATEELALALLNAGGSSAQSSEKDVKAAFSKFVKAWKGSFISTGDTKLLDEIGKAVSLAPVRRGCRIFLFTKPGKTGNVVVSYGVVYRTQTDAVKAPDRVKPEFRMLANEQVTGEYASIIPDLVRPFDASGIWQRSDNMISFIPYVLDGTTMKMFETKRENIDFQIADQTVLKEDRVDILEKKYPCIVLKMVANGRTLVTLKVKDGNNWNSQSFYVEVENPAWKRTPVTSVTIIPVNYDLAVGQSFKLLPTIKPAEPSCRDLDWTVDYPSIASVEGGNVTALKEGLAKVTAASVSDPDKKAIVTVNVFSYRFRMKMAEKKGNDYYCDIPNTVTPYGDGGKWQVSGDQVVIVPFKFDGSNYKEYETAKTNLDCKVEDESLLQHSIEIMGKSTPYVALKMLDKNGTTTVTLRLLKSATGKDNVYVTQVFKVVVNNSKFSTTLVKTLTVTPRNVPMYVNQVRTLTAIPTPADASASVTWHSKDPSIASVDGSKGEVTAIKAGTVQITATANPGGKYDNATVAVSMLAFRLRTSNKQSSGLYHVDIPDIVRPYGDNGLWATSRTTNQLIIFPLASPDGITWNDIKLDEKFIISEIKDQSVLNVSKSGNWFLNFLNNGTTVVTLKVKDPDGSGNILLTKQFTVEVNNPDFVRFNKVSLKVLQNASTVSGVDSVSLLLEYTTYEVDASGKRTGKTAKGNWSDQWSKSSTTKTASIPLSENWYFDNKVHVVLRSRMTKAGAWMTSKQGYVEISDGKLQLKIVGSALKTLDLDGSASGYASFIG